MSEQKPPLEVGQLIETRAVDVNPAVEGGMAIEIWTRGEVIEITENVVTIRRDNGALDERPIALLRYRRVSS